MDFHDPKTIEKLAYDLALKMAKVDSPAVCVDSFFESYFALKQILTPAKTTESKKQIN